MNALDFAKKELEIAGLFDKDSDYNGMIGKAVMELMEVFYKQGHSGFSASIARSIFNKLADYKPITPLKFTDDEWFKNSENIFQNKRNPAVFKDGKNGKPYYIDAVYMKNQKGLTYSGSLEIDGKVTKRFYIKDSAKMPEICIDIIDWEVNKDDETKLEPSSGWWMSKLKNPEQIKEVEKYYEIEYHN